MPSPCSYGPVLVRLAWHAAGTYDKETKTGGSNGATMRYAAEAAHGANAGLKVARELLEKVRCPAHCGSLPRARGATSEPHSRTHTPADEPSLTTNMHTRGG